MTKMIMVGRTKVNALGFQTSQKRWESLAKELKMKALLMPINHCKKKKKKIVYWQQKIQIFRTIRK